MRVQALVVLAHSVAAEVYTCSPRCSSTEQSINWEGCQTVETKGGQVSTVCNTIEPSAGTQRCHYHFHSRAEVGQCLNDQKMDFVFIGDSYALGLGSTVFPWFDETIQDEETYDVVSWLGTLDSGFTRDSLNNIHLTDMLAAQEYIDVDGNIVWKGAASSGSANGGMTPYRAAFSAAGSKSAASAGHSSMSLIYALSFEAANAGLDGLQEAGRANRKGYMVVQLGAWWYYCYKFKKSYCSKYPEGAEVLALGSNWDAVQANLLQYYTTFLKRIQKDFPNYTIVIGDYAFARSASVVLEPLSNFLKGLGDSYGYFLDVYGQAHSENSPPPVDGHVIHQINFASFQRVLSLACKPGAEVECAEEVVMTSTCQYYPALDTGGPTDEKNSWYYHWNTRPCDFVTYPSSDVYTGSMDDNGGDVAGNGSGGANNEGGSGGGSNESGDGGSGGGGGSSNPSSTIIIAVAASAGFLLAAAAGFIIMRKRKGGNGNRNGRDVSYAHVGKRAAVVAVPVDAPIPGAFSIPMGAVVSAPLHSNA